MARFSDDECTLVGDIPSRRIEPPTRQPPALEQIRGPGAPRWYKVMRQDLLIGRGAGSHITIDSAALSRQHLRLEERDGEVMFTDLNSANGVYLNGVLAHAAILRDGDLLECGEVAFIYHEGGP